MTKTSPLLRLTAYSTLLIAALPSALAGTQSVPLSKNRQSVQQPEAPAQPNDEANNKRKTRDPLEPLNRGIFQVNKQVYRFFLRPLAKATEAVFTKPVLKRVGNVFENAETPVRVASSLLQGKVKRASQETGKLLLNTTVGLGGIFRPSDKFESLSRVPSEDMGQAFGKWGIPDGPYLVLPILGPSSARDLPGKVADTALSPLTWLESSALRTSLNGTRALQQNPERMRVYDDAVEGALEEYIALREAFLDYRAEAVAR